MAQANNELMVIDTQPADTEDETNVDLLPIQSSGLSMATFPVTQLAAATPPGTQVPTLPHGGIHFHAPINSSNVNIGNLIAHAAGGTNNERTEPSPSLVDEIKKGVKEEVKKVGAQLITEAANVAKDVNEIKTDIKKDREFQTDASKALERIETEINYAGIRGAVAIQEARKTGHKADEIGKKLDLTTSEVKQVSKSVNNLEQTTIDLKVDVTNIAGDVSEVKNKTNHVAENVNDNSLQIQDTSYKIDKAAKTMEEASVDMKQASNVFSKAATKMEHTGKKMDENIALQNEKIDGIVQAVNPSIDSLNKLAFQQNAQLFIDYMRTDELLPHLVSHAGISMQEMAKVNAGETSYDKVLRLLIILDKKVDGVENLKQGLIITHQKTLADILDRYGNAIV